MQVFKNKIKINEHILNRKLNNFKMSKDAHCAILIKFKLGMYNLLLKQVEIKYVIENQTLNSAKVKKIETTLK